MKKFIIIVVIVAILGGGAYWLYRNRFSAEVSGSNENGAQKSMSPSVVVTRGDIINTISSSGEVKAIRAMDLTFEKGGKVKSVLIEENQEVEKGQVIAELDDQEQRLALVQAENQYKRDQITSSPSDIEESNINLEIAESNLDKTKLKAPFAGIIYDIDLEEEELIGASQVVAKLIDNSGYEIDVSVDEVDIRLVKEGQDVNITFNAYPELMLRGKVRRLSPVAEEDQGVVTLPVTIELTDQDQDERVKPGLTATADIIVAKAENVLKVPLLAVFEPEDEELIAKLVNDLPRPAPVETESVTKPPEGVPQPARTERVTKPPEGVPQPAKIKLVTKLVDGVPQPVPVMTGVANDTEVEIIRGLQEGDKILANNYQMFQQEKMSGDAERRGTFMMGGPR